MRVAVIGASFARDAYLPAFAQVPDVEVVALASARLESAQSVAVKFNIPHAYDNWRTMLDNHDADIVCVVTPPVYHFEMTLEAIARGAHVICEKPMSMNADESSGMLTSAEANGRIHIIGHELRFNPNRRKIRNLIADGAIGEIRHINIVNIVGGGDPRSRAAWHWGAMESMGGGILGANGSHQIDLLRFWLGDIAEISGHIGTLVKNRIGKDTGEPWTPTADDQVNFTATMTSGVLASVFLSSAARHIFGNHVQIYGSEGTIFLSNDSEKLLLSRPNEDFQDISESDPNMNIPGIGKGIWNASFVSLVSEFTNAVREGRKLNWGATFADGLKTQQIMDAVKRSWSERRWVQL